MTDAVRRYEDAAVLNFRFIGNEWDRRQDDVELRLLPPRPIDKTQLNEWLHGPLWAASRIEEDGSITAWCDRLPAHTLFEIRAMYPLDIFPQASVVGQPIRWQILEEEAAMAETANAMRRQAVIREEARKKRWAVGKWVVIGLSLAGLFGWWRIYRDRGHRPSLPDLPKIVADVPEPTPPALVDYLLNSKQVYAGGLVGTMFDLARRGFITLREEQAIKKILFTSGKKTEYFWDVDRKKWQSQVSELLAYEHQLLEFLFDDLAEGADTLPLKRIRRKRTAFTKFFREWRKQVKKTGEEKQWFDVESYRGMKQSLVISGAMVLLTAASAFLFGPAAIILGAAALVHFVLSFIIAHRTETGERLARHWKALKRYLQKTRFREADSGKILHRLDDYFVYAATFGLYKKVFKELAALIPAEEHGQYIPWYVYHGSGKGGFSPEHFASSFSAMVATTTSAMSTASGAGGGASAGSSGGAGGGGGGAG